MSELVAKEGTYAWALLQLQDGKRVSRKEWGSQKECLLRHPGLADQVVNLGDYPAQAGVKVGTRLNYLPYLERHTVSGDVMPWLASSADLEALDWEVVIQASAASKLILILEVNPFTNYVREGFEKWTVHRISSHMLENGFGMIKDSFGVLENRLGNASVASLAWVDNAYFIKPNEFTIEFGDVSPDDSEALKVVTDKKLTVTIDGVEYPLGHRTSDSNYRSPQYQGSEAEKIGNILKKRGQTFRFHFKWHD
ncbi:Thoeris anti-defense Tad2 family protein [Xenorhabdus bovienii]|uniref:Thoeris anti-defense Tad2 family protein n=1 Tax=Xenorhabdus bovienii TaxID=40576 RepID=UPI0023B2FD23|nr:MW1434 family type I TA system toxin [Xenorhabdus bovienii]MDE9483529.1 DUF2829 domain-containing protein [Xenorhabdus bovienii]